MISYSIWKSILHFWLEISENHRINTKFHREVLFSTYFRCVSWICQFCCHVQVKAFHDITFFISNFDLWKLFTYLLNSLLYNKDRFYISTFQKQIYGDRLTVYFQKTRDVCETLICPPPLETFMKKMNGNCKILLYYKILLNFFFKSKGHSCSIVHKTKLDPDIISLHTFSEFIILVPNENWCTRNRQVTLNVEPDLIKFFSNTLSKAGSKSSSISSIRRGRPSDKASSKWARKYLWFNEVT